MKIIQFLLKILPSCLKNIPFGRLEMINCKILLCVFTLEAPSIDNNNALLAPSTFKYALPALQLSRSSI